MIIHTRTKYPILLIISLILLIFLPAVSLADAFRIPKKSGIDKEAIDALKKAIRFDNMRDDSSQELLK